jgi:hypothetical protein
MKTKHTPGPWTLDYNGEQGFTIVKINRSKIIDEFEQVICQRSTGHNQIETEANARLIAASPEMLEVLIDVYRNELYYQMAPIKDRVKIIIEKATGQTIEELTNQEGL